jgi:hypothetical protein
VDDDGPLTPEHINKFLKRLQARLWPQNHPNGRPFTSHDFRRTKATEMLIDGRDVREIKEQLGHKNITSLIPYLATGSPEFQEWFLQIFLEGIWQNVTPAPDQPDAIAVDAVLTQSWRQTQTLAVERFVHDLILQAIDDLGDEVIAEDNHPQTIPLYATGLPRMTHNCTAHEGVNCGHTELDCFSCLDYYRPDDGSLSAHLVELFRWMVRILHGEMLEQRRKKGKQRTEAFLAPTLTREKLERAVQVLLREKFSLSGDLTAQVKNRLRKAAETYYRIQGKTNPAPTHQAANDYLLTLSADISPLTGSWIQYAKTIQPPRSPLRGGAGQAEDPE